MVCGEWEVGSVPASWSGEQYNIVLDVLEITPHPLYNVSAGDLHSVVFLYNWRQCVHHFVEYCGMM